MKFRSSSLIKKFQKNFACSNKLLITFKPFIFEFIGSSQVKTEIILN